MSALNTLAAYKFIKLLSTKFEDWDAFKLGLIDKDGKTLKSASTQDEKKSMGMFEKLVKNVKKVFHKAPLGAIKIGSLVVALKMLKEDADKEGYDYQLLESKMIDEFDIKVNLNEDISNEILEAGKYTDENDNMYVVLEVIEPVDQILGVNLFEVKNVVTRELSFLTKDTLTKIP